MLQIEIQATLKLEHTLLINGYPQHVLDIQEKYNRANIKVKVYRIPKGTKIRLDYIGKPDRQLEQEVREDFEQVEIFTYNEFTYHETDFDSVQGCLDAIKLHENSIKSLQERIDQLT